MKILIAGSNEIWALEKIYRTHLEEVGAEVRLLPAQSIFYAYYNRSLLHKVLFRLGLSGVFEKIERQAKEMITEWRPDIVWVFKGMELRPALLKWIREQGIRLVNYNPDNPFIFSGRGSGNDNVTRAIGLYDLHLTYDHAIQRRIVEEYQIPTSILPFGFELSNRLYEDCIRQEEEVRVCFLGNPDENRAAFLQQLAGDVAVDVYGDGWDKYIKHDNITLHPPVYGDDFWRILYKYRVQLNLMRQHNPDSHNMRSFEIPGVGAIGLFPRTSDHALYFEEGKQVFLYGDMAECKEQALRLLAMSGEQAGKIREAAREKSLSAGYTYKDRASLVLQEMKKLIV